MLSTSTLSNIVLIIVVIIVSLVIHEFMHAFAAHQLGDRTAQESGRLTLNPLKHIDPVMTILLPIVTVLIFHAPVLAAKPVPFNPDRVKFDEFGAAIVAIAGPISNLCIALMAAFLAHHVFVNSLGVVTILETFEILNVALFVFNMVPIPPLDGSRVLYAFAPEPIQDLMRAIEPYGLMIILTVVVLGGASGLLVNINQEILNLLP